MIVLTSRPGCRNSVLDSNQRVLRLLIEPPDLAQVEREVRGQTEKRYVPETDCFIGGMITLYLSLRHDDRQETNLLVLLAQGE